MVAERQFNGGRHDAEAAVSTASPNCLSGATPKPPGYLAIGNFPGFVAPLPEMPPTACLPVSDAAISEV